MARWTLNKKLITALAVTATVSAVGVGQVGRTLVAASTKTVVKVNGLPTAIARQEADIFASENDLIFPGTLTVRFATEGDKEGILDKKEKKDKDKDAEEIYQDIIDDEKDSEDESDLDEDTEDTDDSADDTTDDTTDAADDSDNSTEDANDDQSEVKDDDSASDNSSDDSSSEDDSSKDDTSDEADEPASTEDEVAPDDEADDSSEDDASEMPERDSDNNEDDIQGEGEAETVGELIVNAIGPVTVYASDYEEVDLPVTWAIDAALSDAAEFNSNPAFEGFKYVYKPTFPKSYNGYNIEVPSSISIPTITVKICDSGVDDADYKNNIVDNYSDDELLVVDPYEAAGYTEDDYAKLGADGVSDNSLSKNSISDNSVSGNAVSDNSVSGNSVSDNTLSGNSVSNNSISNNSVSDNSLSENSVSDNLVSMNSVSLNLAEMTEDELVDALGADTIRKTFSSNSYFEWRYYPDSETLYITYTGVGTADLPDHACREYGKAFNSEYGSSTVKHVVLSSNIKSVSNSAFFYGEGLNPLTSDDIFGFLISDIKMPGVKTVGKYAFANQKNLAYINDDDSLKSVNDVKEAAFLNCSDLTSINVESATTIGEIAFCGCGSLSSVKLITGSSCHVYESAFSKTALQSVYIPAGVSIHRSSFEDSKLKEVVFEGAMASDILKGIYFDGAPLERFYYKDTASIPSSVHFDSSDARGIAIIKYSGTAGSVLVESVKKYYMNKDFSTANTSEKMKCFDLNTIGLCDGNQIYTVNSISSTGVYEAFGCHSSALATCGHTMTCEAINHKMKCNLCKYEDDYWTAELVSKTPSSVKSSYKLSQLDDLENDLKKSLTWKVTYSAGSYATYPLADSGCSVLDAAVKVEYSAAGAGSYSTTRPTFAGATYDADVRITVDYIDSTYFNKRGVSTCSSAVFPVTILKCTDADHKYEAVSSSSIKCKYCGKTRGYFSTSLHLDQFASSIYCDGEVIKDGEDFSVAYNAENQTSGGLLDPVSSFDNSLLSYSYKVRKEDGTYGSEKSGLPIAAGTYMIRATMARDDVNFRISSGSSWLEITIKPCVTHTFEKGKHYWDSTNNTAYRLCTRCNEKVPYVIATAEDSLKHDYQVKGSNASGKLVCSICKHERAFYTPTIVVTHSDLPSNKQVYQNVPIDKNDFTISSATYLDDYGVSHNIPNSNIKESVIGTLVDKGGGKFTINENVSTATLGTKDLYAALIYSNNGNASYYDNINGINAGYSAVVKIDVVAHSPHDFESIVVVNGVHYRHCSVCGFNEAFYDSDITLTAGATREANGTVIVPGVDFSVDYKVNSVSKSYDDIVKFTYAKVTGGVVGKYSSTAPSEAGDYKIKATATWNDAEYGKPCEKILDFTIVACSGNHVYDETTHYWDSESEKAYYKCKKCGDKKYDDDITHTPAVNKDKVKVHYWDDTLKMAYYKCATCDKKLYDENIVHTYGKSYKDKKGLYHKKCTMCGQVVDYSDVTLSINAVEPSQVYDGKKLKAGQDFTVNLIGDQGLMSSVKYSYAETDGSGKRTKAYVTGLPKNVGEYLIKATLPMTDTYSTNPVESNEIEISITKATLKVKEAVVEDKVYDGKKDATVKKLKFTGLKGDDVLTMDKDYKVMKAEFKNPDVGKNKTVKVTFRYLSTTVTDNYKVNTSEKAKLETKGKAKIKAAPEKSSSSKKKDTQDSEQAKKAAEASASAKKAAADARKAGFGDKSEPVEDVSGNRIYPISAVSADAINLYEQYSKADESSVNSIESDADKAFGGGETYDIYQQEQKERSNTPWIILADLALIAGGFLVYFLAMKKKKGEKSEDE